jgi:predicted transcriptional regulator
MAERQFELGTAELEVLKVLWDEGPGTVRQVLTKMHARGRKVAYTTVLTFLTRLEQKGFVASDKSGLAYIYRAAISRNQVSRSRLKNLVREMYDGAAAPLVLQLMRNERFSQEEIAELHKLIEDLDKKNKRQT